MMTEAVPNPPRSLAVTRILEGTSSMLRAMAADADGTEFEIEVSAEGLEYADYETVCDALQQSLRVAVDLLMERDDSAECYTALANFFAALTELPHPREAGGKDLFLATMREEFAGLEGDAAGVTLAAARLMMQANAVAAQETREQEDKE